MHFTASTSSAYNRVSNTFHVVQMGIVHVVSFIKVKGRGCTSLQRRVSRQYSRDARSLRGGFTDPGCCSRSGRVRSSEIQRCMTVLPVTYQPLNLLSLELYRQQLQRAFLGKHSSALTQDPPRKRTRGQGNWLQMRPRQRWRKSSL